MNNVQKHIDYFPNNVTEAKCVFCATQVELF
jgi:hypothetical protein